MFSAQRYYNDRRFFMISSAIWLTWMIICNAIFKKAIFYRKKILHQIIKLKVKSHQVVDLQMLFIASLCFGVLLLLMLLWFWNTFESCNNLVEIYCIFIYFFIQTISQINVWNDGIEHRFVILLWLMLNEYFWSNNSFSVIKSSRLMIWMQLPYSIDGWPAYECPWQNSNEHFMFTYLFAI